MNPYDLPAVADSLHQALQMPEEERALRMKNLVAREEINDVNHWMDRFMTAMDQMIEEDGIFIIICNL